MLTSRIAASGALDDGCETTVTGFRLISRVVPHFGYTQEWSCQYAEDDCVPATDQERAASAFGMGTTYVVATLAGCTQGSYGRAASDPPFVDGEDVTDPALAARAVAAFGKLDSVAEQADDEHRRWWKGLEQVHIWKHPTSGQVLVSVSASIDGMCGEYGASAWQTWEARGGKLEALAGGSAPKEIERALDVDGDGKLEILVVGDSFGAEQVLVDGETLEPRVTLEYRYSDCPC